MLYYEGQYVYFYILLNNIQLLYKNRSITIFIHLLYNLNKFFIENFQKNNSSQLKIHHETNGLGKLILFRDFNILSPPNDLI